MKYLSDIETSFAQIGESAGLPAIAFYILGGIITVATGLMVLRSILRRGGRK